MVMTIVIPDTTLTAMVRDEETNAAGGIESYCHNILPHVPEAIIIDTGSVDDTREILKSMQEQYPHLVVLDREFNGYASTRNYGLSLVKTKRALVIDADERIHSKDWRKIRRKLKRFPKGKYWYFEGIDIYCDGKEKPSESNLRLFDLGEVKYSKTYEVFEDLCDLNGRYLAINPQLMKYLNVKLLHFKTTEEAEKSKKREWYNPLEDLNSDEILERKDWSLSEINCFEELKKINPLVESYLN